MQSNVQAKGPFFGTIQTGLENTPVVEWFIIAGGDRYIPSDCDLVNALADKHGLKKGQDERDSAVQAMERKSQQWLSDQLQKQGDLPTSQQTGEMRRRDAAERELESLKNKKHAPGSGQEQRDDAVRAMDLNHENWLIEQLQKKGDWPSNWKPRPR